METVIDCEIWKDIMGYEGLYKISNFGRIKSLDRFILRKTGILSRIKEKILKQNINNWGYLLVNLYKNTNAKSIKIHRFVAIHFIPNPSNLPEVNHIDGIKTNNKLENLEWSNKSLNQIHAYKMGLSTPLSGEACPRSKLTNQDIINIRMAADLQSRASLGRKYKVSPQTISAIILNQTWKHI